MGSKAPTGFTEFVLARSGELHRTAILLTHDHASAEDLVQTALAKAWRAWDNVRSEPDAYVRRILVNEFLTSRRRRWSGERPTEQLPPNGEPGFEDALTTHDVLITALAGLPPRQQAIVVLRFFHDYTEERTAEVLGIKVGTVKSQTARALAALRVSSALTDQAPVRRTRISGGLQP